MPWSCRACGAAALADDVIQCPACGAHKTSWTIVHQQTRAIVITQKKVALQRGDSLRTRSPDDPANQAVTLSPATEVVALSTAQVRAIADRGHLPPSARVLFVTLFHKGARDLTVTVEALFAARPSEERVVAHDGGPVEDAHHVKLLFVHGDPAALAGVTFPDIHLVDIGEDTAHLCAPEVELAALGRPRQTLPARAIPQPTFIFAL